MKNRTQVSDRHDTAAIALVMSMEKKWKSAWVARSSIAEFSGGVYSAGFLANCDSNGTGPEGAFRIGRSVVYPVASACKWLVDRLEEDRRSGKIGNKMEVQ